MANTVPPPTFQIIGAILVFIGALAALGTFAADHAYWQQLMQGSAFPHRKCYRAFPRSLK